MNYETAEREQKLQWQEKRIAELAKLEEKQAQTKKETEEAGAVVQKLQKELAELKG